jgi:hypothetical protein
LPSSVIENWSLVPSIAIEEARSLDPTIDACSAAWVIWTV